MPQWHDLAGITGVIFILGAYLLLQLNRLESSALRFSLFNGLGSALIIVSLVHEFNFSAFLIEVFWLAISLVGVVRFFRTRGRRP
jgi:hypothetical protein